MNILTRKSWSPYAVGAAIGILSWFTFVTADHPLGVSSVFVRAAGVIEDAVAPAHVGATPYLAKLRPWFDWEFALVVGLFLGAFASARLSGLAPPQVRVQHRIPSALFGGFLLLIGARLAGGCTSGHGISGGLQLAVSGWLFFVSVFAAGIAAAFLIRAREDRHV